MNSEVRDTFDRTLIYRYRSDSDFTLDELASSYIFFTSRDKLNDPFDCFPALLKSNPDSASVKRYIANELKRSFPEFNKTLNERVINDTINRLSSGSHYRKTVNDQIEKLANQIGISCFTTVANNLMMWSHYANSHKGLCLKFDITKDPLFFDDISEVIYTDTFEPIEVDLEHGKELENFKSLFLTKSQIWKNEKELRLIRVKGGPYPIKSTALVSITFGINISKKFQKAIIDTTKNNYPHLEYYQARPFPNAFDLQFDRL